MSIEVNATEQIIAVNATDTSIDINITNQVVDVNATTSVINVDASNGPGPQGPQGPAGQGVPIGGTTNQVLAKASGANYDTQWVNVGVGSVTSVDASGGVGISVTGGPIVSSGTFTITNTAPDQVVSITGSGGTSVTGTYPNFTISSNNLSGFVPYTGATQNVDLGEYEIKAGQFTLDTSPTGTATVGTTRWNNTIGSTETTLKGGNVILKNGVDLVARIVNKVTPNTTLTKAAYQAVRVTGAQGQRLAVAYAQANNDNNSADTIGLVTETIPTNQEGFIITVGQLEDINTTGSLQGETWADGDVLYLSPTTPGALTNVKPVAPQHLVVIGYVEYAHAIHGKIYVKVMNGWELGELHDVNTTGAVAGNVLKYNGTIWTPSSDIDTGITSLNGLTATSQTFATGTSGTDFNISSATSTHTFNLPTASATNRGLLSTTDWSTFNNKQNALGYTPVPTTRTLTINGTSYDLSADRTWSVGTVTSVNMSVPTGFAISGNPITSSGTLALAFAAGYSLPTTSSQANWDAAYNDKINSASVTGTTTKTLTLTQQDGGTITASWTDDNTDAVTSVFGRTGAVVAQSGDYTTTQVTEGTNLYYTEARVSANTDVAANTAARHNAVTLGTANGLSLSTQQLSLALASGSTTGALSSTDWTTFNNKENAITAGTTLQYYRGDKTFQTLNTSVVPESGNLYYTDTRSRAALSFAAGSGAYNSTTGVITIPTNTNQLTNGASFITLASLSGGAGISYNNITGVIASTITQYTDAMARASISGGTGISYNSTTGVITNTITQYTDAMARASLSFSAGSGAYNSTTGVITIPTNTNQLTNGAAFITLGSLSASAPLSYNNGTGAFTISQANSTTNGFLSSTDWNTFNNKQNAITLTTTGTSGAATLVGSTLNIPQYQSVITNPVTGTGTTNYLPKFTGTSTIGNSLVFDNGTNVGVNTTTPNDYIDGESGMAILRATNGRAVLSLVGTRTDAGETLGRISFTNTNSTNAGAKRLAYISGIRGTTNNSAYLEFAVANDTLGAVAMILNQTGNLGLGVTPSAWRNIFNALQIGYTGAVYSVTTGTASEQVNLASNYYQDSAGNELRIQAGFATRYQQASGEHRWSTAGTSTAGSGISFTQAMTLTSGGNLGLGTSSPSDFLTLQRNDGRLRFNTSAGTRVLYLGDDFGSGGFQQIYDASGNVKVTFSAGVSYFNGGNVGIGSTNPTVSLDVNGSGIRIINATAPNIYLNNTTVQWRTYLSGNDYRINDGASDLMSIVYGSGRVGIGTTSPAYRLDVQGASGNIARITDGTNHFLFYAGSGLNEIATTSPLLLTVNGSERMRITSGGNVLIRTTTDSGYELQVSGSVQTRDGGGFVADLGSTVGAAFVASNQSLTGSSTNALVSLQTTWNTTGNADAIYLNVTNTASGAASKLLDLRVNGGSIFRVQRNGRINASSLPTSSAGLSAGDIWNDGGTLKIV